MKLPKARTNEIVEQDLGHELLIYDLTDNKAYTLNETSKIVFKACGGESSFADLKRDYKFTDDFIYLALDELNKNNLLEDYQSSHFAGLTRREAIRRVGLASIIALPVILSLTAPRAADASSACLQPGESCTVVTPYTQGTCCSGLRCNAPNVPICLACVEGFNVNYDCRRAPGGCTTDACNAAPIKNRCCNSSASSATDGVFCYCP